MDSSCSSCCPCMFHLQPPAPARLCLRGSSPRHLPASAPVSESARAFIDDICMATPIVMSGIWHTQDRAPSSGALLHGQHLLHRPVLSFRSGYLGLPRPTVLAPDRLELLELTSACNISKLGGDIAVSSSTSSSSPIDKFRLDQPMPRLQAVITAAAPNTCCCWTSFIAVLCVLPVKRLLWPIISGPTEWDA